MMQKSTIAICDILGFTPFVQKNDLNDIINISINWLFRSLHHSIHKNTFPEETPTFNELQKHEGIGLAWFSDTFLFYTKQDTDENLNSLISCIGWLLFETMLVKELRLRCGISYGEAYIDPINSIYVGKPIIEAYQLEKSQAWSGGALTSAAVERIPLDARGGNFLDWYLVPYKVPLKNGDTVNTLAINWTYGLHLPDTFDFPWSPSHEAPLPEDWIKNPTVCEKWYLTKIFHQDVCEHCNKTNK